MQKFKTIDGDLSWISPSHLKEKIDLTQADLDRLTAEFRNAMQPNDEVWTYSIPSILSGSHGIVLMRGHAVVAVQVSARA